MIKIEETKVVGWEAAIRGMRNPKNSWEKSDSYWGVLEHNPYFFVGENDLKLMKSLVKAGSDHRKFLRYIVVSFDVTAPLYWWKEMETYRVGVAENPTDIEFNSCSTMHKIHDKEFTEDDFSHEHLINDIFPVADEYVETYTDLLKDIVEALNCARKKYLETKDKRYWWQMIQLLPTSYNQKRTVQLNFEVLLNMYHSRKDHKLDEWHTLCDWMNELPYFKQICLEG